MTLRAIEWKLKPADKCWIGTCDQLKLTVESGTESELVEDIKFVTKATIRSLREAGDPEGLLAGLEGQDLSLMLNLPFMPMIANASSTTPAHC